MTDDIAQKDQTHKKKMQKQKENIDALVLIGGDGTFTGGMIFNEEFNFPDMTSLQTQLNQWNINDVKQKKISKAVMTCHKLVIHTLQFMKLYLV